MNLPTVLVTLDFELAWGSFDVVAAADNLAAARWTHEHGVPWLIDTLGRHGVRATWATVGALLEEGLDQVPDMPEVATAKSRRPWFDLVPLGRGEAEAPEWFAPALVRRVLAMDPAQEVGFQGYSHIPFAYPGTSRQRAAAELAACRRLARRWGIPGTAWVFPRDQVAHLPLVEQYGFSCYRAPVHTVGAGRRARAVLADITGAAPSLAEAAVRDGLVAIPGTLMVRHAAAWRGLIPDRSRLRRLGRGLERAAATGGLFHVSVHPINLYAARPRISQVLDRFLESLGQEIAAGRVRNPTMSEVAADMIDTSS